MDAVSHLNSLIVTKQELLQIADDIAEYHDESESFELVMYCIAERHKENPQKAGAVWMRMQALARYVGTFNPKGWTLPKQVDGSIPTLEAVFAAASVHPLVAVGDQLEFEPSSFELKILELADTDGRA